MTSNFPIFIDDAKEKENRIAAPCFAGKAIPGKEKRPMFATLTNNVGEKAEQVGVIKAVGNVAQHDENAVVAAVVAGGKGKAVMVEQPPPKPFSERPAEAVTTKEESSEDTVDANASHGSLRNPLQELQVDTPMSVGCLIASPMSVDKSLLLATDEMADKTAPPPRNDRERFFEIEEYQMDILEYLKEAELKHRPKAGYMRKQPDITHGMRTILVDWLVEVCEEYRLQNETLCLAISYIDRFLSVMSVLRAKLQLVGTAAMFIAAKYEEIYPPDVGEFVYITDDTYTKSHVLRMEQLILKVLSFDLSVPTTLVFSTLYTVMNEVPDKVKFLTMYLCELSLLEADPYLHFVPSKIAAAALAVARYTLEYPIWSKSLEERVGYSLKDLEEIIMCLNKSHHGATALGQQAIQEKYKSSKFMQVSTITPCEILKETLQHASGERNESVRKMISSLAV